MNRLTKEQAAILGCVTGVSCGPFSDVHKKAEELLGRPIWTHEFGTPDLWEELRNKAMPEFMQVVYEGDPE